MNLLLDKMIKKQRLEFDNLTTKRMKTMSFPDDVTEIKSIPYLLDNIPAHRLDVYRPTSTKCALPVIVNVHGGGLLMGSKEFNRFYCAQLCKLGFVVFSIEYRLIPEVTVFEQFADVSNAMNFIERSVTLYGGDPTHIYMVGDSAGAYLITYTTALQRSRLLADATLVRPSTLHIRAIGLISGMFYTNRFDKIGMFLPKMLYGSNYKNSTFSQFINPEHSEIVENLPPCYLITSHADELHNYTTDFADALKKVGASFVLNDCPPDKRLVHAFSVFEPTMDKSVEVTKEMVEYLLQH